jgi:hypothetical protein
VRAGACLAVALGVAPAGCGAPERPAAPAPAGPPAPAAPRAAPGPVPSVEQEVGALDERATARTFGSLVPKIERCQLEARARDARLEALAGEVELEVHVGRDGGARSAFLPRSTLGDRAAERCIVGAARAAAWPRPEGGGDAVAKNSYQLPPRAGRDAVAWPDEKVAASVKASARAFRACRGRHRGRFELTAYVGGDGAVIAAGASSPDAAGDAVADCLAEAAKGLKKLPPSGGRPAKVTFAAP